MRPSTSADQHSHCAKLKTPECSEAGASLPAAADGKAPATVTARRLDSLKAPSVDKNARPFGVRITCLFVFLNRDYVTEDGHCKGAEALARVLTASVLCGGRQQSSCHRKTPTSAGAKFLFQGLGDESSAECCVRYFSSFWLGCVFSVAPAGLRPAAHTTGGAEGEGGGGREVLTGREREAGRGRRERG